MANILPYPWQHPDYADLPFDSVSARVQFCLDRRKEAFNANLPDVGSAWEVEAARRLPDLLTRIAALKTALAFYAEDASWPDPFRLNFGTGSTVGNYANTPIHEDFGDIARDALYTSASTK